MLVTHDRKEGAIQPPSGLSWSRDGRFILAVYWTPASDGTPERYDLVALPVDGGEMVTLNQVQNNRAAPVLHPEGGRLAYVDGELRGEIWVMEGWK
jgi:hypothetical protein